MARGLSGKAPLPLAVTVSSHKREHGLASITLQMSQRSLSQLGKMGAGVKADFRGTVLHV